MHTSKYTVLAACLLLVNVGSATAASYVCGAAALVNLDTCTCPTGTGILTPVTSLNNYLTSLTGATVNGVTTFTSSGAVAQYAALALCTDLMPGYQITTLAAAATVPTAALATSAAAVTACVAGTFCAGTAAKITYSPTATSSPTSTATWAFAVGLGASCGVGTYCPAGAVAATTCPGTGTSLANSVAVTSCSTLGGIYVSSFTAASGSTAASATTAVCPLNSYCPGGIAMTAAGVGATACPFITVQGDASSTAAVGVSGTATTITSCILDPGYYQTGYTAPSATVAVCLTSYYCAGQLPIVTTVTNSNSGATACPKASTVGDASYTPFPGTSSNAISDCYTMPGYYISALTASTGTTLTSNFVPQTGTGALCQANEYCPGGIPVPTTLTPSVAVSPWTVGNDGSIPCPGSGTAQTTLSVAVAATAATANNGVTDCVIPAGFYVSTLQGSPVVAVGVLTACPAGASCVGGTWSDILGYGITSILPSYVVTTVSANVPTAVVCGANAGGNLLIGAACAGATGSNVLTVGYGAVVTNSDYYVSAAGNVAACPFAPCTLGQTLTTAGGASVPAGYYLSAGSTYLACPTTGVTCAGASLSSVATVAAGVTINSGYYVSAVASGVPTATACPTGATCAGATSLTVGAGFSVNSGYVVSALSSGVVTVIACPTGAVCSGGSGTVPGTGAVTTSAYYLSGASSATAIGTLTACATTDVCVAGLSLKNGASPATPLFQAIVAAATTVTDGYYQISGTNASTAVYAVCPTGATCAYTGLPNSLCTANVVPYAGCTGLGTGTIAAITANAGVLGSNAVTLTSGYYVPSVATVAACPTGATCAANQKLATVGGASANVGYYVSAVSVISACPTGAVSCGAFTPSNTACTAAATPYYWCTGLNAGTPVAFGTPVSITPGGINSIYPGYMTTATYLGNAIAVSACPTGAVCVGDLNTNNGGDLPYSGASTTSGYYVSAAGTVTACPAGASCTAGVALTAPGGGVILPGFYVATAGTVPAICPSGSYCPGGGNLGIAGGSFACPVNSTLTGCNDFVDNAPSTVNSSPVSVAPAPVTTGAVTVTPAPVTVSPAAVTVTPAAITVTPAPITVNVPAPVSAASTRSSALVLVLAALVALAAF